MSLSSRREIGEGNERKTRPALVLTGEGGMCGGLTPVFTGPVSSTALQAARDAIGPGPR